MQAERAEQREAIRSQKADRAAVKEAKAAMAKEKAESTHPTLCESSLLVRSRLLSLLNRPYRFYFREGGLYIDAVFIRDKHALFRTGEHAVFKTGEHALLRRGEHEQACTRSNTRCTGDEVHSVPQRRIVVVTALTSLHLISRRCLLATSRVSRVCAA